MVKFWTAQKKVKFILIVFELSLKLLLQIDFYRYTKYNFSAMVYKKKMTSTKFIMNKNEHKLSQSNYFIHYWNKNEFNLTENYICPGPGPWMLMYLLEQRDTLDHMPLNFWLNDCIIFMIEDFRMI